MSFLPSEDMSEKGNVCVRDARLEWSWSSMEIKIGKKGDSCWFIRSKKLLTTSLMKSTERVVLYFGSGGSMSGAARES